MIGRGCGVGLGYAEDWGGLSSERGVNGVGGWTGGVPSTPVLSSVL